ncbi:hypothetical protein CQW23_14477 [Capsicum baccatum]|uniref:non-specific serine/threonine protein kinase n=1 Tax=Capsicum baccatum TaxID=33114 RepID=A0A2G2WJH2_CAPBA|nr:hypothetical protein CQW23_14477 [Capsicum baccatum]
MEELVVIKRALQGSMQGAHEFKTEIELLSRVHHKNVVGLAGFYFDQAEQMLVYEYILNGKLKDGLSSKTGIRLDWTRRLRIAVGTTKSVTPKFSSCSTPEVTQKFGSLNGSNSIRVTIRNLKNTVLK